MNKNMVIGIDAMDFVYELPREYQNLFLKEKKIRNWFDKEYGIFQIYGGKVKAHITMPMIDREDNVLPLSLQDATHIKRIKNDLLNDLQNEFNNYKIEFDPRNFILNKFECGETLKVNKETSQSECLNLIDRSINYSTNIKYHRASKQYQKENETVIAPFKYKNIDFKSKSYDKTQEQRIKGNQEVEDGLLRIEIIFLKKAIHMIFGDDITLDDVLEKQNLKKLFNEFKIIFRDIIVGKYVLN